MRFLLDENVHADVADSLLREGHDVRCSRRGMPGAEDRSVLSCAQREGRILLTFDKDFGELAFLRGLPAECGIVLFRIAATSPRRVHDRVMIVMKQRDDWAGHFTVVEEDRIRMTPIAGGGGGMFRESQAVYRAAKGKKPRKKSRKVNSEV